MVARAGGEDPGLVARQAASALAGIAGEPAAVVTACRRLVDRQPSCGPVWWLAARVLTASEPGNEAWRAADELRHDPTPRALADALPDGATVTVLGSPWQVGAAVARRGDVWALVVDVRGDGGRLLYELDEVGGDVAAVAESGLGAAVLASTVVLLEAEALGRDGLVAVSGSRAAAAVARHAGIPVWAVAGVGRVLPAGLWERSLRPVGRDLRAVGRPVGAGAHRPGRRHRRPGRARVPRPGPGPGRMRRRPRADPPVGVGRSPAGVASTPWSGGRARWWSGQSMGIQGTATAVVATWRRPSGGPVSGWW